MMYSIENLTPGLRIAYLNKGVPMYGRVLRLMPSVLGGCVVVRSWDAFADIVRVCDITAIK